MNPATYGQPTTDEMMATNDYNEITKLAEDWELRRQRFVAMGMANTFHLSPEKRRFQAAAYHQAEAEMMAARNRLDAAKQQYGSIRKGY